VAANLLLIVVVGGKGNSMVREERIPLKHEANNA